MSGFSVIWILNSSHMSLKYWIMMLYGKIKNWLDKMGSLMSIG